MKGWQKRLAIPIATVGMVAALGGAAFAASTWSTLHNEGPTTKGYVLYDCGVDGCQPLEAYNAEVGGSWSVDWTGSQSGYATMSGTYPICQEGTVYNAYGSYNGEPIIPASGELNPIPSISWTDSSYGSTGSFTINKTDGSCYLNSTTWAYNSGESNNTYQQLYYPDLYATAIVQLNCPSGECQPDNGQTYVQYNW